MQHKRSDIMAPSGLVQARVDNAVKAEAAAVPATVGLAVSDAVRLLLMWIAHDKAMPFNPLIPDAETMAAMREAGEGNSAGIAGRNPRFSFGITGRPAGSPLRRLFFPVRAA
jgi:DNA-damage-inducible protein J